MSSTLSENRITFLNDDGEQMAFVPSKDEVSFGSDPLSDIRFVSENVKSKHFKIYQDSSSGKIKVCNLSSEYPVKVNGETVTNKKELNSGDIIDLFSYKLRWESKAEIKRRLTLLTKSEKKQQLKKKVPKFKGRITIHSCQYLSKSEEKAESSTDTTPRKAIVEKFSTPTSTPLVHFNKENESLNTSINSLNVSGLVKTSFTPTPTRSSSRVRRTPSQPENNDTRNYESPIKTLAESPKFESEVNTPSGVKKSMHLIDLKTPFNKSTPKTTRKTPRNKTLLKSALKNSAVKSIAANESNRKVLTFVENSTINESSASELSTINISSETDNNGGSSQEEEVKAEPYNDKPRITFSEVEGVGTMLKSPNNSTIDQVEQETTQIQETAAKDNCINLTGISKLMKTPQRLPKNELTDMRGVKELLKTPAPDATINISAIADLMRSPEHLAERSLPKDGTENLTGIQTIMTTPQRALKGDISDIQGMTTPTRDTSSNMTGVADLLKTPKTITTDSDVADLNHKIDEALEDNNSLEINSQDSDFDNKCDRVLYGQLKLSKSELQQTSIEFEQLASCSPEMNVTKEHGTDENEAEKQQQILNWIATSRDSLAQKKNTSVRESSKYPRFSDITPNNSIDQSDSAVKYDAAPKLSIFQTIMNNSVKSGKLSMSPITRHSLSEGAEIVENYNLGNDRNATKSLRSTRKKLGNALASLHNLSNPADMSFDQNTTCNTNIDEIANQSMKSEALQLLSLDQPQPELMDYEDDAPEEVNSNIFMQFAKDAVEMQDENKNIYEVSSNETSIEEQDQESSSSESEEELTESESSDDDKDKDNNRETEKVRVLRLSDSHVNAVEEGINLLEVTKVEEDQQIDSNENLAVNVQFEKLSTTTTKEAGTVQDEKVQNIKREDFFIESSQPDGENERSEIIDFVSNEITGTDVTEDIEMIPAQHQDETASTDSDRVTASVLIENSDDFEIPATQYASHDECHTNDVVDIPATQDSEIQDSSNDPKADESTNVEDSLFSIKEHSYSDSNNEANENHSKKADEVPPAEASDDFQVDDDDANSQDYSAIHHDETVVLNDIDKTNTESNKNESTIFSETEFSRVEINQDLMNKLNTDTEEDSINVSRLPMSPENTTVANSHGNQPVEFGNLIAASTSSLATTGTVSSVTTVIDLKDESADIFEEDESQDDSAIEEVANKVVERVESKEIAETKANALTFFDNLEVSQIQNEANETIVDDVIQMEEYETTTVNDDELESEEFIETTSNATKFFENLEVTQIQDKTSVNSERFSMNLDFTTILNVKDTEQFKETNKSDLEGDDAAVVSSSSGSSEIPSLNPVVHDITYQKDEDQPTLLNAEKSSSEQSQENELEGSNVDRIPVVEEMCIKKEAYVTTDDVNEPKTPSRSRVTRVNYAELASGSPSTPKRTPKIAKVNSTIRSQRSKKGQETPKEPVFEEVFTVEILATVETKSADENNIEEKSFGETEIVESAAEAEVVEEKPIGETAESESTTHEESSDERQIFAADAELSSEGKVNEEHFKAVTEDESTSINKIEPLLIATHAESSESIGTPSRRRGVNRLNYAELASGSTPKRVPSATPAKTLTQNKKRGRKVVEVEDSLKTEKSEIVEEEKQKPPKTVSSNAFDESVQPVQHPKKRVRTAHAQEVESVKEVVVEAQKKTKREIRGTQMLNEKPTKAATTSEVSDHRQNEEAEKDENSDIVDQVEKKIENVDIEQFVKPTRRGKKLPDVNVSSEKEESMESVQILETAVVENDFALSKRRGGRKQNDNKNDIVEVSTSQESIESTQKLKEPTNKPVRGRKQAPKEEISESSSTQEPISSTQNENEPAKKQVRGRKQTPKGEISESLSTQESIQSTQDEVEPSKKPVRGRKQTQKEEFSESSTTQESIQSTQDEGEPAKKSVRVQKIVASIQESVKSTVEEELVKKPIRGRKKKEEPSPDLNESFESTTSTRSRRGKSHTEQKKVSEDVLPLDDSSESTKSTSSTRARRAPKRTQEEISVPEKPTARSRGVAKKNQNLQSIVEESSSQSKKLKKADQAVKVSQEVDTPIKKSRAVKLQEEEKQIAIPSPKRGGRRAASEAPAAVEEPKAKSRRGGKVEVSVEAQKDSEPEKKDAKVSRKRKSESPQPEAAPEKKSRRGVAKSSTDVPEVVEEPPTTLKRLRGQKTQIEPKHVAVVEPPEVKSTRGKTNRPAVAPVEEPAPPAKRSTRARK